MTPAVGVVFIIIGLLDGAACWFLIVPRLPAHQRTAVMAVILSTSAVLVGVGVATMMGVLT